jgi:hypothetical protein
MEEAQQAKEKRSQLPGPPIFGKVQIHSLGRHDDHRFWVSVGLAAVF